MRWRLASWGLGLLAAAIGTAAVTLSGLSAPALFGSLLGGMAYALFTPRRLPLPTMPGPAATLAQGMVGVSIGAYVDAATAAELAAHGGPILAVCGATVVASLALGAVLTRHGVSLATGMFAMISGGASGVSAIAHELGADDRVVSVVQYLRVVIVIAGMPLVTAAVFRPPRGLTLPAAHPAADGLVVAAFVTITLVVGLLLAKLARLPAGAVLGPLVAAVALSMSGLLPAVLVPSWPLTIAYATIGLQVGLRFTRASLRQIAGLLPAAVGLILALLVTSALLGLGLVAWVGVTPLDAYLATTPGGLYAVLATAVDSGADVSFVLTVQVVRLIAVLAAAPAVAHVLRRRGPAAPGFP